MTKPTQEQIKKLWEWCGFKHIPYRHLGTRKEKSILHPQGMSVISTQQEFWVYPDGSRHREPLPIDLNNLFKYPIKLKLDGYMMFTGEGGIHFIASKDGLNYEAVAEKEEDAIFEAIYKVMEASSGQD